ncbi:MAG: hypothetical protein ACKOEM_15425, partial [Planctomycetia bacterium]
VRPRLTVDFVVSSETAKSPRLKFLIPGSVVRVHPGVVKSTGKPVLFLFQARGSFVAPASILRNPQISTGRGADTATIAKGISELRRKIPDEAAAQQKQAGERNAGEAEPASPAGHDGDGA